MFRTTIPRFDAPAYLRRNESAKEAVDSGKSGNALTHYITVGIDEGLEPTLKRENNPYQAAVERCLVSSSGYIILIGWLADEGSPATRWRVFGAEYQVEIETTSILRLARRDVETAVRDGAFDYGFMVFGRVPSKTLLHQPFLLNVSSLSSSFQASIKPEIVSDVRLMDTLLILTSSAETHSGREFVLNRFFSGMPGQNLVDLFHSHVVSNVANSTVERFGVRPVKTSFISVLFGSTEPMLVQPVLFVDQGIDFGEWIYVCNSSEDAPAMLRIAKLVSNLYDVMITVIVMPDNVGFGAANNAAVQQASGRNIVVINPDVYPMRAHAKRLSAVLDGDSFGSTLWGGLLFYDQANLMHSGMFIERDSFAYKTSLNQNLNPATSGLCDLLRVEHFDKGVPFVEANWQASISVPAISGAVMAFDKGHFETLGGFSTRYIYGHYEDADLSIRWRDNIGPVGVHHDLRLVHLEGQGSRSRGGQYRGAQLANRYLFSETYRDRYRADSSSFTKVEVLSS